METEAARVAVVSIDGSTSIGVLVLFNGLAVALVELVVTTIRELFERAAAVLGRLGGARAKVALDATSFVLKLLVCAVRERSRVVVVAAAIRVSL